MAAEVVSSPAPKHTQIDQEEDKAAAWITCKMTEALEWLEYISLKESVIWKAWIGWEEGLRLAHRQQEIGEAAARMETTSSQPILTLRLTEGEHGWFEAWKRHYFGSHDEIKREGWMGEWKIPTPNLRYLRKCMYPGRNFL